MSRLESQLGEWTTRNRWWIILASLVTVTITGSGLQFLTFNSDHRVFFGQENPQLQALEDLEKTYTKADNVAFILEPKDGNVFTRENTGRCGELD